MLITNIKTLYFIIAVFTWGRRMSKKLELLRRNDGQKSYDPAAKSASTLSSTESFSKKSTLPKRQMRPASLHDESPKASTSSSSHNSFKTFFHRIGSTGMLNRHHHSKQSLETNTLYRSSSTSQLNSSSYIKGEDPTDGINLTTESKVINGVGMGSCSQISVSKTPIKAASCDDIAKVTDPPKRGNFPYAFLRSKLSVLPEENGGSVLNQKRILENTLMRGGLSPSTSVGSPYRQFHHRISAESPVAHRHFGQQMNVVSPTVQPPPNCSRSNSIRESITDEGSSTISNSPRTSNLDWEPTYQRLNSCLSSNESGYDSDGRHTEEHNSSPKSNTGDAMCAGAASGNGSGLYKNNGRHQIRRLSSCSSVNSVVQSYMDCATIRRRFRPIKLDRLHPDDQIGILLAPQYYHADDLNIECRYLIAEIDPSGLAHRDGRLRIGDEIVNVNGNRLRGMSSYGTVQQMMTMFVDNSVELVIAHDELTTFPDVEPDVKLSADSDVTEIVPQKLAKRLSYSALNIDCLLPDEIEVDVEGVLHRGTEVAEPIQSSKFQEARSFVEQRIQELQAQAEGSRRSPMSKGLELTPLHSSTEYVPVYATRASISNTISDDEKWQILSKKRSDQLSKQGYAHPISMELKRNICAMSEKSHSPTSNQSAATLATAKTESKYGLDNVITPQYRSIRINKELLQLTGEFKVGEKRIRLRQNSKSMSSISNLLSESGTMDAKEVTDGIVIDDRNQTPLGKSICHAAAAATLTTEAKNTGDHDENADRIAKVDPVVDAKIEDNLADSAISIAVDAVKESSNETATYVEGKCWSKMLCEWCGQRINILQCC